MRELSKEDFDLVLGFVVREKRYLKTRETSFSERQLKEGKKLVKDALSAVKKIYPKKNELEDALQKTSKRQKLAGQVWAKCKRFLSCKQAKLIVENYRTFSTLFAKPTALKPLVALDPTKEDRYYAPRKHEYR